MTRLPIVNYRTMEKVLLNLGFVNIRSKGSHVFYRHPDRRATTLPNHPGRDLSRPLTHEILREIKITLAQFLQEVKRK
ncbi:MAG: type II toxin-antitoxin system HicA family toxin [Dehalococcoidales bacterium]